MAEALVHEYLRLGLALGRHIDGLVDAYYGPADLADQAAAGPLESPASLAERARRLLGELMVDRDLEAGRRTWLAAQARGLHTTARKLAGEPIGYLGEIEDCYGVRPGLVPEDEFSEAHKRIDDVLPGSGSLAERYIAWREQQIVPAELLGKAIDSLAEDFRERTGRAFGLPLGEQVEFELVTHKPWSGFNYYLGGLRSRVAVNIDLPVPSTSLGPLVAHEAYPGHHTEHCRKEVGLVRQRSQIEETIFLVGTPQCLLAEGLADLGIEVIAGRRPEPVIADHLNPLGVAYDAELVGQLSIAGEALGAVRGNAAILIHDEGMDVGDAVDYVAKWALLPRARAEKVVDFLIDPTWRAYAFCYIEGLRLCRRYVAGEPARFERLVTEQVTPSELAAA
ncbi:MAG TPA: hypothetical protein VMO88_08845 [Acidimicrobiales bacterium]|nr:hypothetical protein [Acidimicrobiales bacterium]